MYLVRGLHNIGSYRRRLIDQRCAATMGNFDGMHLGHTEIFRRLKQLAAERQMRTAVLFFEPHAREFFDPDAPHRLMTWRDKVEQIWRLGLETAIILYFNDQLRQWTPQQFVRRVFDPLELGHLVVGDDLRFGVDRSGSFADLKRWGEASGVEVEATPTVLHDGERVSSTRVRDALVAGDLPLATALLGRHWSFSGRVVVGQRRGRKLGFPTANLKLPRRRLAIAGVYAVSAWLESGQNCKGVANMGHRPTFGETRPSLEVHLLDFDGDIYGQRLRLEFVRRLRPEVRFEDADALKAQIGRDVEQARAVLQ